MSRRRTGRHYKKYKEGRDRLYFRGCFYDNFEIMFLILNILKVSYDLEARPGVSNLINIHSFVTNKSVEDICREAEGLDTGK